MTRVELAEAERIYERDGYEAWVAYVSAIAASRLALAMRDRIRELIAAGELVGIDPIGERPLTPAD